MKQRLFITYRFYNASNELLYIGKTINPATRFSDHTNDKGWWSEVSRIELEHHASLEAMNEAEKAQIKEAQPTKNLLGKARVPDAKAAPSLTLEDAAAEWSGAKKDLRAATARLHGGIVAVVQAGMSESEAARVSGISRPTVRKLLGK